MRPALSAAVLLGLVGCADFPPKGDTEIVTLDTDTDTVLPTAQVTWGDEGVTLTLTNSSGYNFTEFGIAQNDDDCIADEEDGILPGCYTAEDCVNGDYIEEFGATFEMCHNVGTRTSMTLLYVKDGIDSVVEDGKLLAVDGQYTSFPDDSYEYMVTYYLKEAGGQCWRWGLDTSYFADTDCSNAN